MDQQLVNVIKDIAIGAVQSKQLCNTCTGEVVSIDPLSIKLDNYNIPVPAEAIDVVDTLGLFEQTYTGTCKGTAQIPSVGGSCQVSFTGSVSTAQGGGSCSGSGSGTIQTNASTGECSGTCEVTVTIDNRLKVGDHVHMIRKTGGRRFLVVGRIS